MSETGLLRSARLRRIAADLVQMVLQGHMVERAHRQIDEQRDAIAEHAKGIGEGEVPSASVPWALAGSGIAQSAVIG